MTQRDPVVTLISRIEMLTEETIRLQQVIDERDMVIRAMAEEHGVAVDVTTIIDIRAADEEDTGPALELVH